MTERLTVEAVMAALEDIPDPEIPVVSVVDLGIVQGVEVLGDDVTVRITPTFTGCPALEAMRTDMRARLLDLGAASVDVVVHLDPPWSTDRIRPAARERMRAIGLAPPPPTTSRFQADSLLSLHEVAPAPPVACPFCGSHDTALESAFGPTICRSLHYCHACQQPFEEFKAL